MSNRAVGILEHCATNAAAHFGGPHGMFVDVPVDALLAVLKSRKDALDALSEISQHAGPQDDEAAHWCSERARQALASAM